MSNRLTKGESGASPAQFCNVVKPTICDIKKPRNPTMSTMKQMKKDNNNESSKGPSNADAFSVLETAME
ncbi:hypothetical protein TNCV_4873491 [Trichonephila clavipes]|nr:hypothetical protein TNCV_4873491 [Trichonephila clavipes]